MKNSLFDLRFLIGLFFLIIGAIVLIASFFSEEKPNGSQINLYSGLCFIVFSLVMLLSYKLGQKPVK